MCIAELSSDDDEALRRLYDKRLICGRYKAIEDVAKIACCSVEDLKRYGQYGLVIDNGKRWKVASLSKLGVRYVKGLPPKKI